MLNTDILTFFTQQTFVAEETSQVLASQSLPPYPPPSPMDAVASVTLVAFVWNSPHCPSFQLPFNSVCSIGNHIYHSVLQCMLIFTASNAAHF